VFGATPAATPTVNHGKPGLPPSMGIVFVGIGKEFTFSTVKMFGAPNHFPTNVAHSSSAAAAYLVAPSRLDKLFATGWT
jgi:hypothetical protein